MSICEEKNWTMNLLKDDSNDSQPLIFKDLKVYNGGVTGKVYDPKTEKFTYFKGTCSTFGPVGHMTFFFTAASKSRSNTFVDIILFGGALEIPGEQPRFSGRFVVLPSQVQQTGLEVGFDEGDTGTGNGMQAG
jgi:hypothetical protein